MIGISGTGSTGTGTGSTGTGTGTGTEMKSSKAFSEPMAGPPQNNPNVSRKTTYFLINNTINKVWSEKQKSRNKISIEKNKLN